LRVLAQCIGSDDVYLFTVSKTGPVLALGRGVGEPSPGLSARVGELLLRPQERMSGLVEIRRAEPGQSCESALSFCVVLLPNRAGHEGWVGAVALRETAETSDELLETVVADIARLLADDFGGGYDR
jgi:hypothetical protein